ncbi:hypothetical protein [Bacillus sp. V2I10]|uniref:hypothetical protein n=1 Tax=Bacillus sp. V2I10 TaxID=3042276 RepID=UPI002787FCDB|nr:hypothetical protein [Bacillus sp. V2I10]MDQ0859852.1 hypothetical protein [Bacillus sp. V2I10]
MIREGGIDIKEFNSIKMNGTHYNGYGYIEKVDKAIVIESAELLSLFENFERNGYLIKEVDFIKSEEMVDSFKGDFIVYRINKFEIIIYPFPY